MQMLHRGIQLLQTKRKYSVQTATLYFWRWFSSFQLELARPNYINRKIEAFERFLVMQKAQVKFML